MDAWQSHCPRCTVWEDALDAGLIELDGETPAAGSSRVRLSALGQAALDGR
jgi:hypothetical protein